MNKHQNANTKLIGRLMFRLLPIQILLAAVGAVNGIVSSFFASNYVGVDAMSAVGLYNPINLLIGAISMMLVGGSAILCGKYMGENQQERLQNVFHLDLLLAFFVAVIFSALFVLFGLMDLTGFLTRDAVVRKIFNRYLLGQAIGLIPMVLGNQLPAFLLMENKSRRTLVASLVYIVVNMAFNYLFVQVLHLEAFGLALASSLGMWVFFAIQAQFFLSPGSHLRLKHGPVSKEDIISIIKVGVPGALGNGYQTVRGLIVNGLLDAFVGTVGISAFATANYVMNIFWAIPTAMLAVSRLLMSVSIGEEDRQTLTDIMRVTFRRFIPLMCAISAAIILCAVPLTRIFYREAEGAVFNMTVWGLRLLPLCMPFSIICMHFVCYGQASGKQGLVHVLSVLDGAVCVSAFTAVLIRLIGMNSVYIANVLNGVVTTLVIVGYACLKKKHFPRNMEELMVIPDDFGVSETERMDMTVKTMEDVVTIAEEVQCFCRERGVDERRAYLSGLAIEEMAGNIVEHGFVKDKKSHSVDIRVIHKDGDMILRLKDDCLPFDPSERQKIMKGEDITKNMSIRMMFKLAKKIQHQNMLGINVLTIWV